MVSNNHNVDEPGQLVDIDLVCRIPGFVSIYLLTHIKYVVLLNFLDIVGPNIHYWHKLRFFQKIDLAYFLITLHDTIGPQNV